MSITVVILVLGSLIAIIVGYHRHQKRKEREQLHYETVLKPQNDWIKKVGSRDEDDRSISRLPPPPDTLDPNNRTVSRYYTAIKRVKRAEEWLGETFLLEDPKAKLRELLQFNLKLLSDKDVRRVENARSSLAVSIANELWEQALSDGGNIAAMSELILFTAPGRYQGYRYATDKPYVEPEGWQELVARLYPSPELHHLRVRHMDNEEVILLAATALRTNQIIDAKIVMAYWNESAKIREVIPQDLIAQVVVLVERYNARQKITQVPAT